MLFFVLSVGFSLFYAAFVVGASEVYIDVTLPYYAAVGVLLWRAWRSTEPPSTAASSAMDASTGNKCAFYFLSREAVLSASGHLGSYGQLRAQSKLEEVSLEFSDVVLGTYRHEYLAVSHRCAAPLDAC